MTPCKLPATRVRSGRPIGRWFRRVFAVKGLCAKRPLRSRRPLPEGGTWRFLGQSVVQRRHVTKIKAKDEELDWSEKSREVFETAMDKGTEYSKAALSAWDTTNDKPAIVAIAVIALTVIYAADATLGAMESVPLVGASLKLIGLYVTGWFIYRMVAFEADRDEIVSSVKSVTKKITGE